MSPLSRSDPPEAPAVGLQSGFAGNGAESSIGRKSIRGGAVTLFSQAIGVAIQLASVAVLARLLTPADYGVVSMATALTTFAGLFRDLGLSYSTIQRSELSHAQASTLYWINVAFGLLLTVTVFCLAPLVALFYQRPELTTVTQALSATFVLGAFGSQPGALLARQLRFGLSSTISLSSSLIGFGVSCLAALNGLGYWALVAGPLGSTMLSSILLNTLPGWRPSGPTLGSGVRSMLRFGSSIAAFDFFNYFARNLDSILIGRFHGAETLGHYTRAYQLLMFPITNLRAPINAVVFPALSRLQSAPSEYRNFYKKSVATLAFFSMPVTVVLFVVSGDLVRLALGTGWDSVAPLFRLLAITAFVQAPFSMIGVVMLSSGHSGRYARLGACNAVALSAGFVTGVFWGPQGVAIAYAVVTYLSILPSLKWAFRGTLLRSRDFFVAVRFPALCSIAAGVCAHLTSGLLPELAPLLAVSVTASVFGIVYLSFAYADPVGRGWLRDGVAAVRDAYSRRTG